MRVRYPTYLEFMGRWELIPMASVLLILAEHGPCHRVFIPDQGYGILCIGWNDNRFSLL